MTSLRTAQSIQNGNHFTQAGTGAVARPFIAKIKDGPVSLEDFGFVSGNALAALNLALASGAPIKLKAGKYTVNGLLNTVTNTPVSLEGHGGGASILEFTGATSGLIISQDDYRHPTFIRNLLFQTTQQEAGDALTITYSKTDSITNRAVARCVLEDVWAWGDNVLPRAAQGYQVHRHLRPVDRSTCHRRPQEQCSLRCRRLQEHDGRHRDHRV
ncbi:hypothetical protein AJ88_31945 [Mesorhizobium amorphae CCBAU 01583]|nr:hypothetical protein AJ88_31945 [Mesorhizobium amorphae CCBAU 01583]